MFPLLRGPLSLSFPSSSMFHSWSLLAGGCGGPLSPCCSPCCSLPPAVPCRQPSPPLPCCSPCCSLGFATGALTRKAANRRRRGADGVPLSWAGADPAMILILERSPMPPQGTQPGTRPVILWGPSAGLALSNVAGPGLSPRVDSEELDVGSASIRADVHFLFQRGLVCRSQFAGSLSFWGL